MESSRTITDIDSIICVLIVTGNYKRHVARCEGFYLLERESSELAGHAIGIMYSPTIGQPSGLSGVNAPAWPLHGAR